MIDFSFAPTPIQHLWTDERGNAFSVDNIGTAQRRQVQGSPKNDLFFSDGDLGHSEGRRRILNAHAAEYTLSSGGTDVDADAEQLLRIHDGHASC